MKIPYQIYRFSLTTLDEIYLPSFKGSTLRGGFGNAFRKVVCALKKKDCGDCLLKKNCIYSYIFETTLDSVKLTQRSVPANEKIPHPFVIEPPMSKNRRYDVGEELSFYLILIGRAIEYLPYFIYTFDTLGDLGIGKGQGRYLLSEVFAEDKSIFNHTERTLFNSGNRYIEIDESSFNKGDISNNERQEIKINIVTPLRLKSNRDLVVKVDFAILIKNALRRLCLLSIAHCSNSLPSWDYRTIIKIAESVQIAKDETQWFDWERYSNRQKTTMKLGGVIGEITYSGNIGMFIPILKAVEILHIGKGTAFGLGKITIN